MACDIQKYIVQKIFQNRLIFHKILFIFVEIKNPVHKIAFVYGSVPNRIITEVKKSFDSGIIA